MWNWITHVWGRWFTKILWKNPASVTESIPYSQALRITRICSEEIERENRFCELKNLFIERRYPEQIIDAAIIKARSVPRLVALRPTSVPPQPTTRRPVFAVSFDPRLPNVTKTILTQWKVMTNHNIYMKEVYPEPTLVAHNKNRKILKITWSGLKLAPQAKDPKGS